MRWQLAENWDKLVGVFMSAVLGGVIGFFSAVNSIDREIAQLREKVESEIATLKAQDISEVETDASLLKQRVGQIIDIKLKGLDELGVRLNQVNDAVGRVETKSEMLQKQYENILLIQVTRISNIRN